MTTAASSSSSAETAPRDGPTDRCSPRLEVDGLSVTRGGRVVVDGVSFAVQAGRASVILGANGSGKTSLLRGLLGFDPTRGGVRVMGRRRESLDRLAMARAMAWVPQTYDGFGAFTVEEFVSAACYHAWCRGKGAAEEQLPQPPPPLSAAMLAEARDQVLSRCDLLELGDRRLDQISIGQRQRALLAAAFMQQSAILLLDEPLASLDPGHATAFLHLLRQEMAERHVAVVMVSHDVNVAAALDADVLVLRDGRVLASGPWTQLCPALLQHAYDTAFEQALSTSGQTFLVPAMPPPVSGGLRQPLA